MYMYCGIRVPCSLHHTPLVVCSFFHPRRRWGYGWDLPLDSTQGQSSPARTHRFHAPEQQRRCGFLHIVCMHVCMYASACICTHHTCIPEAERTLLARSGKESVRNTMDSVEENCVPSPNNFKVICCLCGPMLFFSCIEYACICSYVVTPNITANTYKWQEYSCS